MGRYRHSILIVFLLFFAILLTGWARGEDNNVGKEIKYQFELAPSKEATLLSGLKLIKLGDSKKRVEEIVGSPSRREDLFDKKGKFNSTVFDYDIKRVDIRNVNVHDKLISIYFDRSEQVVRIAKPSGEIEELHPR